MVSFVLLNEKILNIKDFLLLFKGFDKFRKDLSTMIGKNITNHKLFNLWRLCWTYINPLVLFV